MVEKDLKKLRRAELLEIMLDQSYEIDQLRKGSRSWKSSWKTVG